MKKWSAWSLGLMLVLLIGSPLAHDFGGSSTADSKPEEPKDPPCQRGAEGCCPDSAADEGDPVSTYRGNLHLSYADLEVGTVFPIRIVRKYDGASQYDTALGYGWSFEHDRRLFEYPDGSVIIRSGCGRRDRFVATGGAYVTPRDAAQGELKELPDGSYEYRYPSGKRDLFDADGRLVAIENRLGQRHELLYDSRGRLPLIGTSPRAVNPTKPMVVAYQPRLTRIQERSASGALTGYAVDFAYDDTTGRLIRITASDGRQLDYSHDETAGSTQGNLVSVAGLNDYAQSFAYADPGDVHNITTIVDGAGAAPIVHTYNTSDQVTRQVQGGTTIDFAYLSPVKTQTTEIVTNASGQEIQRRIKTREFDEAGYLTKIVDATGNEQRFTYNASKDRIRTEWWDKQTDGNLTLIKAIDNTYNGQAQKLTESVTLDGGETVTTTWTYDHGWVATEETSSSVSAQVFHTEFEFARDEQGKPVNIAAIKRRNDDGSFTVTRVTYCSATEAAASNSNCPDIGLIKQVDGPRDDVADVATRTYYGDTDVSGCGQPTGPCHHRADLRQQTDALGQVVDYLRYDAAGRVAQIRDANGVVAEFTYHPRGYALQRIVRGADNAATADDAITNFAYDARANLTRVTQADGSYLDLEYDSRSRLTKLRDVAGAEVRYTLDSVGNHWKEESFDASGARRRTLSRTFDLLGRQLTQVGAQSQTAQFAYDGAGRAVLSTDALGAQARQNYDDLDRVVQTIADAATDGIQATTRFTYDAVGNLRQVIDPKGLATTYQVDALGRLTQLTSPDTGVTTYTYDAAGNRKSQIDARNETAAYTYDALNRLTGIGYGDSTSVGYSYDTAPSVCQVGETFGKGRLGLMLDSNGTTTQYCYDRFGDLVRKVQSSGGQSFTVRYAYTRTHELQAISYPDGTVVDYGRDAQGRVREVGVTAAGSVREVLLSGAGYYPFGPSSGWAFGDGRVFVRQYDQDYLPQSVSDTHAGGLDLGFKFDAAGRLTQLHTAALADPPRAKFDYDALGRLTHFRDGSTGTAIESYGYDATGNRAELTTASGAQPYTYLADSHRLTAVDGVARTYDASGNTISIDGTAREFTYNAAGRISQTRQSGVIKANYFYSGNGEQVRRDTATYSTHFVYNESGQLLGQYDGSGNPIQTYIWLDGLPVGVIAAGKVYYVEPDHLGAPRTVIDPQRQTAVWSWDLRSEAFGNSAPNVDPDNDGTSFTYDLRFPGQRYDMASGTYYNYFRTYDPDTGRYLESDPIGLMGGASTYGYVGQNPFGGIDPLGLFLTTVDAYCMQDPQGCAEALGDMANGAAAVQDKLGNHCAAKGLRKAGNAMQEAAPLLPWLQAGAGLAREAAEAAAGAGSRAAGAAKAAASAETEAAAAARGARNPKVAEAARKGQQTHKDWDYGPGFEKEQRLPSGKKADAVNWQTREVVELKPNNPNAIRRGEKQVEQYRQELEQWKGGCWTCRVETYD